MKIWFVRGVKAVRGKYTCPQGLCSDITTFPHLDRSQSADDSPLPLDPQRLWAEGGAAAVESSAEGVPKNVVVERLQPHPPAQSDCCIQGHPRARGSRLGSWGSALWNPQRSDTRSEKTQTRKSGSEKAFTPVASQGLNTPNPPQLLFYIKVQKSLAGINSIFWFIK